MQVQGTSGRSAIWYGTGNVLAGVLTTDVAKRLLCGQCGKFLDQADDELRCYCYDMREENEEILPVGTDAGASGI